jgi:hypothetical protein
LVRRTACGIIVCFLVRPGLFLRPDLQLLVTSRAAAVKDGRRSPEPHMHLPPGHALTAASTASILKAVGPRINSLARLLMVATRCNQRQGVARTATP